MKTMAVPFIEGLEKYDFNGMRLKMENDAAKAFIDTVCWPEEYPYAPDVSVSVARSATHIVIWYRVSGMDLRATVMEDNGPVWEDSCCEFFVGDPSQDAYYNFEMNCIGTLLAAKRKSRTEFRYFGMDELAKVTRHSSLERKEYNKEGEPASWQTAVCIPFNMIGADAENLPASLRANFYKCGDKTAHPHFLSWNPVRTPQPDFHRPEFFGLLTF